MSSGDVVRTRVVHRVLAEKVEQYGNRDFLYFEDQVFGYEDFDRESNRVAAGLMSLGLRKGEKVAIVMNNRPEYLFLWFGLSKLGVIEVPINTAHKGNLLTYMVDKADCRFLVVESCYLDRVGPVLKDLPKIEKVLVLKRTEERLPQLDKPVLDYEKIVDTDGTYDEVEVLWSDPVAIMFTSGTTGPSKGVLQPHNMALCGAENVIEMGNYGEEDCLYNPFPLFHAASQFALTMAALISGARLALVERFSASRFWDDIRRYNCTVSIIIGGIMSILFKADPKPDDKDNPLRILIGPNAPRDIIEAFEKRFGVVVLDNYGTSEISICTTSTAQRRKLGSCGNARPDYSLKVVDDNDMELGPNTPGELVLRPHKPYTVLLEYYKMPDKTVEAWRNLWFHTGDYMYYDEDGFFYFVDRKKDALRRRGENISSAEVETVVASHPAVLEVAAIAAKSEVGEDEVMICVIPKPGQTITPEQLMTHCEPRMAYFMVPRFVRFMKEMPKTPSERVQKYKLREEGITPDTWDREKAGYKLKR
jgi:crotonobetaine/carnitine-CoA ligase